MLVIIGGQADLKSVAHNIADSLASGVGFLIGVYQTDIFGEAFNSDDGTITVDFLAGASKGAAPSQSLVKAIKLYSKSVAGSLCEPQIFAIGICRTNSPVLRSAVWKMLLSDGS